MAVTITSTSDSEAQVAAALNMPVPGAEPVVETPVPVVSTPEPTSPVEVDAIDGAAEDDDDDLDDDDATTDPAVSEAARTLGRRGRGAKARIDKMRAQLTAKDRELEELRQKVNTPVVPVVPVVPAVAAPVVVTETVAPATFDKPKPKREDFDDYDVFEEARDTWITERAEWGADQRIAAADARRQEELREAAETARRQTITEQRNARVTTKLESARSKYPDFDEVVKKADDMKMPDAVLRYLDESENGIELVYHLTADPTLGEKIGAMTNAKALVELGKLEARLETLGLTAAPPVVETKPVIPTIPVSKAPEPMQRVGGGGVATGKDPSKMDHQEYKAYRRAGGS